ncbi:MAG TPA: serine hydrolase domain-containing protein [Longimicrobium sp.]|nr:serine hydrolase domain-containing protein [Longimicrobium sp.]
MRQREGTARRRGGWRATRMGVAGLALYVAGCSDAAGPNGGVAARRAAEAPVVFDQARLVAADEEVREQVDRGGFPGAALVVGVGSQEVYRSAVGSVGWTEGAEPVDAARTMFDLASLTKAVATTTAVMLLVEDGRMRLDDPVSRYVPEFAGGKGRGVTIRQLLSHTAGTRAGAFGMNQDATPEAARRYLITRPLALEPGKDILYSDIGFVVLWTAAERAAREPLSSYLRRRVWVPLGMTSTRMAAPRGCPRCAPTLRLSTGEPYRGGSYDEVGRALNGLAGNAGLFTTAADLARFAAMIANGGQLDGVRVLRRETIDAFLRPQPGAGSFALGWVTYCREGKVPDHVACKDVYAVGHTGSTGTALWIDPRTGTWMVLLTNRVYEPKIDTDMTRIRRRVYERLTGQVE